MTKGGQDREFGMELFPLFLRHAHIIDFLATQDLPILLSAHLPDNSKRAMAFTQELVTAYVCLLHGHWETYRSSPTRRISPLQTWFPWRGIRFVDLYLLVKDRDSQGHERMLWPAVFVVLGRVVVVF